MHSFLLYSLVQWLKHSGKEYVDRTVLYSVDVHVCACHDVYIGVNLI